MTAPRQNIDEVITPNNGWDTNTWVVFGLILTIYGPWTWLCVWLAFTLYQQLSPLIIGVGSPAIGWLIILLSSGLFSWWKHQQLTQLDQPIAIFTYLGQYLSGKLKVWRFGGISFSTLIRYIAIGTASLWLWSAGLNYIAQWLGNLPSPENLLPAELFTPWGIILIVGLIPLTEELIFRGALQSALHNSSNSFINKPLIAVVLTASAFTLLHGGYWSNPLALLNTFVLGLGLSGMRYLSKSCWPGVILHTINNGMVFITLATINH